MAREFAEVRLGDLVRKGILLISDGYRVRNEELGPEGIPFVRGGDIGDGWINTETDDHIRPEFADRVRAKLTRSGDVAFITKGTVGRAGRLRPGQPPVVFAPQVAYWRVNDLDILDPGFLFYLIRSRDFQSALYGVKTHGSMVADYVSISQQHDFTFRIPDIASQRAIAHILGTLDDRIEVNRRMNATLQAMARTIFKSWFVDFEPVRAKAEGRDPGLLKPLTDMFPNSLENSILGEIPKGWEVGKLGNVLEQRLERCVASDESAARPYVPIDCISSKSLFLTESKRGEEAQSSLTRFYKGDLLFGAMRPYFHKVCIAPFDGTTRTTAFVLFPRRSGDFAFSTLLLHHPDTIDYATRHSTGSTIPYAVWSGSLENMPVAVPPREVRERFDEAVRPILNRIQEMYFQHRTLTSLRDILLPKLISGELRVKDQERFQRESL